MGSDKPEGRAVLESRATGASRSRHSHAPAILTPSHANVSGPERPACQASRLSGRKSCDLFASSRSAALVALISAAAWRRRRRPAARHDHGHRRQDRHHRHARGHVGQRQAGRQLGGRAGGPITMADIKQGSFVGIASLRRRTADSDRARGAGIPRGDARLQRRPLSVGPAARKHDDQRHGRDGGERRDGQT